MLEPHSNKDMLLEETVKEIMINCSHESIPKYIDSGLKEIVTYAEMYEEMINWIEKE